MRHWLPACRVLRDGNRVRRVCVRVQEADGWRKTTRTHGRADEDECRVREGYGVVMGGNVPRNCIPAVEKGFYEVLEKITLLETRSSACAWCCAFHAVDSSELVFPLATIGAFREAFLKTKSAGPRADHDGGGRRVGGVPECVVFASFSPSCPFEKPDRLSHDRTYVARSVTYS